MLKQKRASRLARSFKMCRDKFFYLLLKRNQRRPISDAVKIEAKKVKSRCLVHVGRYSMPARRMCQEGIENKSQAVATSAHIRSDDPTHGEQTPRQAHR